MASKYNVKVQFAAWVAVSTLATVVVMTGLHLKLELDAQETAARRRAEISAQSLAKSVAGALAIGDTKALPGIVAQAISDDEIYHTRIIDKTGEAVYRPWNNKEPVGLLVVTAPVGDADNPLGVVEVGLAQTDMSRTLMQVVLADLLVGMVMVVAAVGISFYASLPIRRALAQLSGFIGRAQSGKKGVTALDTDLEEVDQVSRDLGELMARVREAQLATDKAQKELKAAQKEMDEYTYVISHDLKEPLRGIEAFSKFLVEDYRDQLDEEGRHHIDVIRNSALRMQRLINDLLKFSRLGQPKNPLVPVGLNAMLMHVRLNLQYAIDAKKVDLRVEKLPTVACDATAMTEVFLNLISNAIKYNDKDRPVVEVGCTEQVNPETEREEYEFYVRDNGPGIKPEFYEKIFQLFQRLQRDDEGTGIGLTIVKRVVEWHGGRIRVASEPGQGSVFYFTLPRLTAGETAPPTETDDADQGERALATTV